MALFGSGSGTAFWRTPIRSMADLGGRPTWIACWTKGPTSSTGQGLAGFAKSTLDQAWSGTYIGADNKFYAFDYNDAHAVAQVAGDFANAGVWQHVFATFSSASSRTINGGPNNFSDFTTLSSPQTLDSFLIGQVPNSVPLDTARSIAEVVFGRGVLDPVQLGLIRAGRNPLAVARSQIIAYFPLRGDLADLGPMRSGLAPVGNPATKWDEHPPVALPPRQRLFRAAGGGTTVFFTGLGRSIGAGRTANTQSTAIRGTTSAGARLVSAQSTSAAIVGRTSPYAAGRAPASPVAPLIARSEVIAPGKASLEITAPNAAKTQAGARGNATAGSVSQLSGSARTQSASAGRATGSAVTSLSGHTAGAAGGKAAASPSAPLSGKAQAGSRASGAAGGVSQLSGSARTAGLAAGRAASSLGTVASARTQGGARGLSSAGGVSTLFGSASTTGAAAGRAALSPAIVLSGKARAQARALVGLSAASPLSAAGATRGRAAGRAAIAVNATLSASTISRGAMRNGLSAGTALVAVARSMAFGHAINGDQNPRVFDPGNFAVLTTDGRLAVVSPDGRFVTLRGP